MAGQDYLGAFYYHFVENKHRNVAEITTLPPTLGTTPKSLTITLCVI
jgi:hypothetical protein